MSNDLKPCPFCGGTNISTENARDFLSCMDCHTEGPAGIGMGSAYAAEAWNARASLAQTGAEPVATLHDDGHWTHKPGRDPLDRFSGKARLDVYAAPTAQPAPLPAREPIPFDQLVRMLPQYPPTGMDIINFARSIEACHGITATPATKEQP